MKVFGITGWKNSGKTHLVARLVRHFSEQGLRVSTLKRAHCEFDIDQPGTDSYQHRQAGASEVLITSSRRWALMHELGEYEDEVSLSTLLCQLTPVDLVLIEGFKSEVHPKLQVIRPDNNPEPLPVEVPALAGIATDKPAWFQQQGVELPVFELDDTSQIARFVLEQSVDYRELTDG